MKLKILSEISAYHYNTYIPIKWTAFIDFFQLSCHTLYKAESESYYKTQEYQPLY